MLVFNFCATNPFQITAFIETTEEICVEKLSEMYIPNRSQIDISVSPWNVNVKRLIIHLNVNNKGERHKIAAKKYCHTEN